MNKLAKFILLCGLIILFSFSTAFAQTDSIEIKDRLMHRDYIDWLNSIKQEKHFNKSATSTGIDSTKSHVYPDVFSSAIGYIDYLSIYLNDSNYSRVTGIKANRFDIVQNGTVLFRSYSLKSYSSSGRYWFSDYGNPCAQIAPFANSDGDNYVDIILYNNDVEVGRIANYLFRAYSTPKVDSLYLDDIGLDQNEIYFDGSILNAKESDNLEIYIKDNNNELVCYKDNSSIQRYPDGENLYFETSITIDNKYLFNDNELNVLIKVNGQFIDIIDSYDQKIRVTDDTYINSYWYPDMESGQIITKMHGVNLSLLQPYSMVFYNINHENIGRRDNIVLQYDEEERQKGLIVDLTGIIDDEDQFIEIEVYDKNGELFDSIKMNETSDPVLADNVPYSYTRLKTKYNANTLKCWTVQFNKNIDNSTTTSGIQVVNSKNQNIPISVSITGENTLVVTPSVNYQINDIYTLWINGVKKLNAEMTNIRAGMDFTVE